MYSIDGSYVGVFDNTRELATGVGPLRIGDSYWDFSRDLKGLIDDVQVYDTALTDTEIAYLTANPGVALPTSAAIRQPVEFRLEDFAGMQSRP